MKRETFRKLLRERVLVLDGSMGVFLQRSGMKVGESPEGFMLANPDVVRSLHREYIEAGADIILTNTFGATPLRLREFKLEKKFQEVNRLAVRIARQAAAGEGAGVLIGASVGPTGKFIAPIGDLSFEEACETFRLQIGVLVKEGIDLVVLETFSDIREFKAAIMAAREFEKIPVIAHMTFSEDGRTVTGTDPLSFLTVAEAMGADVIGANCSVGPKELLPVMKILAENSVLPLSVEPNAGLPRLEKGVTVFKESPEKFSHYAGEFLRLGVNIIGGCCGTTPEHIRAIRARIDSAVREQKEPAKRKAPMKSDIPIESPAARLSSQRGASVTRIASRTKTVTISDRMPVLMIGERINPTGKKRFSDELKAENFSFLREEAIRQAEEGADILDINVGIGKDLEKKLMPRVIRTIQQAVTLPIMIDSSDLEVIEEALKEVEGKCIINSVNGDPRNLKRILPLAKKYGAAIVGLCLDEKGIPETPEKRCAVAGKIVRSAAKEGIKKEDIFLDTLTLSAGVEQEKALHALEAIRLVKEKLGVRTILGVSNVSFGLPDRSAINAAFVSMAIAAGLDAAICNPGDPAMKKAILSSSLLRGKDAGGKRYLSHCRTLEREIHATGMIDQPPGLEEIAGMPAEERIYNAVLHGDREGIEALVEAALKAGHDPYRLVEGSLIKGIEKVGDLFGKKVYFLPQVLLAAETMKRGFDRAKKFISEKDLGGDTQIADEKIAGRKIQGKEVSAGMFGARRGKIVFATVRGDIHDIGKNICVTLLENHGFEIIDLGKDVETAKIIREARKQRADIVALSALMTTTMVQMKEVVDNLRRERISCRVMVGGAVLTESYAKEIGADAYGKDAIEAVRIATSFMEKEG